MDEMKSALERALERADRMGRLSPEEMRLRKESEYTPIGKTIAERFREHGQTTILAEQLGRIAEEGREIATRSALSELIAHISLENNSITERSLKGLQQLRGSESMARLSEEIDKLSGQYAWQKKLLCEEHADETDRLIREHLSRSGISGSAISGVNLENNEEWSRKTKQLLSDFEARLARLKHALQEAV